MLNDANHAEKFAKGSIVVNVNLLSMTERRPNWAATKNALSVSIPHKNVTGIYITLGSLSIMLNKSTFTYFLYQIFPAHF